MKIVCKTNSADGRWWSKYYYVASDQYLLDYTGCANMDVFNDFGNCEDLIGYDAKHIAWLIAKDDYIDKLSEDGYDLVELCEEGGRQFIGMIIHDRLYDIDDDIISLLDYYEEDYPDDDYLEED